MSFTPFGPQFVLAATSGLAGFALINGTQTFAPSAAVPNDGQMHLFYVVVSLQVTSAETGGQVNVQHTDPQGNVHSFQVIAAGQGAGLSVGSSPISRLCAPGTTVSVLQQSALTAGAAVLNYEIWVA